MDVTGRHLPFFGTLPARHAPLRPSATPAAASAPATSAGRSCRRLALGVTDEHTALPLVDLEPMRFPPEPLLSVGAAMTQHAIVRKDEREDAERRADPLTSFLARLPRRLGYELGP